MSAAEIIERAHSKGVDLRLEAGKVRAQAPGGVLTAEVVEELKASKPQIKALLRIPDLHGVTWSDLREAAGEDWPEVRADPDQLEALAKALADGRQLDRGIRPEHWTEVAECAGCGPVYTWPGLTGRLLGCPWCHNRAAGLPIPRPKRR